MNAGDALWYLHAKLTMMERRCSTDPALLELIAKMREDMKILGDFIQVPPPPADKLQQLIEYISTTMSSHAAPPAPQQPDQSAPPSSGGSPNSAPDRIEAVKTVLDEMIASGHYDWADMIRDINAKLSGADPYVTDRQCRAIRNIGCKNEEFWDTLEEEHPEAVSILMAAAAKAD